VSADVPDGFWPIVSGGEFMRINGPLYLRRQMGFVQIGLRIQARHCNPAGICHGGMVASFCDMLLPLAATYQVPDLAQRFLPTINLQIDYLAPSPMGAWLQGEAEVLRRASTLAFVQGLVHADDAPVARCSGIFRIGPPLADLGE
jgi:uncharacterized protein (TIGR00369 family)